MKRFLRAIDVCAGGGGWGIAARGLPIKIVEAFDFAEHCLETYAYNHPETKTSCTDATKIVTEAAALQGFPDDYVFVGTPDRAWKMVAQAIPIPVGRAILTAICQAEVKA